MIKQFLGIVKRYFQPYKIYILWSIVLNFVAQWLNVFSFVVLIPILNILFKIDQNVYTYQEWTWSTLNKDQFLLQRVNNVEIEDLFFYRGGNIIKEVKLNK